MDITAFEPYFDRLNIKPQKCSLKLVEELQKKHIAAFTFNNIDVMLGKAISLNLSDIFDKIVTKNAGGYCFEHNQLFYEILKALGFGVRCLIARVINNQDIDAPRTHRVTLLEWEGDSYLVDVGFGLMCPTTPLKLNRKETNAHRVIINQNGEYQLEVMSGEGYYALYTFDLCRYSYADCIVGNYYSNKHPDAVFVNNFVISLILPDTTLSLRNKSFHRISQTSREVIDIQDHQQLQSIIEKEFTMNISQEVCQILFQKIERITQQINK